MAGDGERVRILRRYRVGSAPNGRPVTRLPVQRLSVLTEEGFPRRPAPAVVTA